MSKVTEWLPGDVKPVRVGVYERCWHDGAPFPYPFYRWNGTEWKGTGGKTPKEAAESGGTSLFQRDVPWRGLASDPSKAPK